MSRRELLPAPDGPMMAVSSPARNSPLTFLRIVFCSVMVSFFLFLNIFEGVLGTWQVTQQQSYSTQNSKIINRTLFSFFMLPLLDIRTIKNLINLD